MEIGANCSLNGESLVLLGAAAAIQLAQGLNEAELALLSSFFGVLSDNLDLIATQRANCAIKENVKGEE